MSKSAIPKGLNFWLSLPEIIQFLQEEIDRMAISIVELTNKVDAVAAIIPNIQADYAELKAEIAALTGQIDPTLQGRLDVLTAKLGATLSSLTTLDNSVVPPVVPPTP